jgi:hypothetical protein
LTSSVKLAGLALAMILVLLSSGRARQLFLNVYVDDTSSNKTLIVGNVDDLSGLPFLKVSDLTSRIKWEHYQVDLSFEAPILKNNFD